MNIDEERSGDRGGTKRPPNSRKNSLQKKTKEANKGTYCIDFKKKVSLFIISSHMSSYLELGKRKVLWPVGREAPKLRS